MPNGLSQSNVGIKIKEQVAPNWFVVGDVNFGFDPYSFQFANGPRRWRITTSSRFDPGPAANGDSSRAGGIDNTRAYVGVSNPTFGTLTFGRQYALTNDLSSAYDPFGGAYAFSLIGTSGTVEQGTGDDRDGAREHLVQVPGAYNGFRAGAIVAIRRLGDGNGARRPTSSASAATSRLLGRRDLRLRQGRGEARHSWRAAADRARHA